MQAELQTVLDLQPAWVAAAPSEDMALRGLYIRNHIADFVRERLTDEPSREDLLERMTFAPVERTQLLP